MLKLTMSNLTQASRVAGAVLILLSLSLSYPGTVSNLHAQTPSKAKKSSPAGGPPKEGIKVHGRWTIDIRNPDGKLVSHHQFENALTGFGAASLGQFLQRTHKPGEWAITVGARQFQQPCVGIALSVPCHIFETTSQYVISNDNVSFKSLTITSEGGPNTNRTVLAGTATAGANSEIGAVGTLLVICPVDTQGVCNPNLSNGGFAGQGFTETFLATPINVVRGQIIQVTVVISFS